MKVIERCSKLILSLTNKLNPKIYQFTSIFMHTTVFSKEFKEKIRKGYTHFLLTPVVPSFVPYELAFSLKAIQNSF